MNKEKAELIKSVLENDTIKKLKSLETYIESNPDIQNNINKIVNMQKHAISTNNQESVASLLNELTVLKSDINVIEYINTQEDINELMINIRNIIESNLKG